MISIIVAIADGGVIGGENSLLWHISEDLRRFKAITTGHPVVMGRKTYESIGRPLPNRVNVVVSRNRDMQIAGCEVVGSLDEAVKLFSESEEIFIIGGGEIYRQAMPIADKLYLTRVHCEYKGDTFFPEINPDEWQLIDKESFDRGDKFEYPFEFENFERVK